MSIKIIKTDTKYFSLADPLLGKITGLFIPISSGKRQSDILLKTVVSGKKIQVELLQSLDCSDQSVLFALISLAGIDGKKISSESKGPRTKYLWNGLKVSGGAETEFGVLVTTTQAKILNVLGWNKSGNEYKKLKETLDRLSNVNFKIESDSCEWRSRLLSNLITKDDSGGGDHVVDVALNPRIAHAVDGGQFNRICLEERRQLNSNIALLVHAWLSFNINPGHKLTPFLDTIVQRIWDIPTENYKSTTKSEYEKKEERRKRSLIVAALKEISELKGWKVSIVGSGSIGKAEVSRPRVIKGHL
ncbi:replication protein C, IncQ-type [Aeromonas jandaei]|uniref:replication protein C, IncQ-type n=1 Tax=Aeromonas jandaei TaxID=650 RepID=UPI003F7A2AE9